MRGAGVEAPWRGAGREGSVCCCGEWSVGREVSGRAVCGSGGRECGDEWGAKQDQRVFGAEGCDLELRAEIAVAASEGRC